MSIQQKRGRIENKNIYIFYIIRTVRDETKASAVDRSTTEAVYLLYPLFVLKRRSNQQVRWTNRNWWSEALSTRVVAATIQIMK